MTTEQVSIDDKNRTIAIFMELYCEKTTDFSNREIDAWYDKKTNIKKYEGRLQYHSDWNEVMPVWKKFRDLSLSEDMFVKYNDWLDTLAWYLYSSNEPARFSERLYYAILWYNIHK